MTCVICLSPYLKATVDELLRRGELGIPEIATLVHQSPIAVMIHVNELLSQYIELLKETVDRLEVALAQRASPDAQLRCEPGMHWFRFDTGEWTIRLDVRMYKKETHYECVDPFQ